LIYWSPSIEAFLELWTARAKALQGEDARFGNSWSPLVESKPARREVADAELRSFFDQLPPGAVVHDLRAATPGTEVPFERLATLARGGGVRRRGLMLGFTKPPRPVAVEPQAVSTYLSEDLMEEERALLRSLPSGTLVIHERDLPPGGRLDMSSFPGQDESWRPPFHLVYPKKRWWRFW
jgi:hypothetical protein